MKKYLTVAALGVILSATAQVQPLKISANKRFISTADGKPFFWQGETAWLLFVKCNREDVKLYLDTRQQQGFNVIQAMLLHDFSNTKNVYGDWALKNFDAATPDVTPGSNFSKPEQYDYWDNVDYIIDEAAKRGMYMALVPVWGSNVKAQRVNETQAEAYGKFLAKRYKNKKNIIWLNGGDIPGKDGQPVWEKLGATIKMYDKKHLMTFHPRGRTSSSDWFHNAAWLDFNMFQSGHKSYRQDTSSKETRHYGEDNWKFVEDDYALQPVKPTIDGEPSYEDIPHGLHDTTDGYWNAADIRRYAYWSVFAGGFGFTYGHNAVMQFYTPRDTGISFFPLKNWKISLQAKAATQMQYLKQLMLSKNFYTRQPAQQLIADNGEQYDRIIATQADNYALFYVYTGRDFKVNISRLGFVPAKAAWYNPSNGQQQAIEESINKSVHNFNPPGQKENGNDWVLILEK